MATGVDTFHDATGESDLLQAILLNRKSIFHSFTHGGMAQIIKVFDGTDIDLNYADEEIIEMAHLAGVMALLGHLKIKEIGKPELNEAEHLEFMEMAGRLIPG